MQIDELAPDPQFSLVRMRMVDADAMTTMRAVLTADLTASRLGRLLTGAREVPNRVISRVSGRPLGPEPKRLSFGGLIEDADERDSTLGSWRALARTDREFVAGAIGRFWERDYGWVEFESEEFRSFAEPDHAKTLVGFRVDPYGPDRSLLVYESRTVTTDETAHRKFSRYWRLLRPFVGLLMNGALGTIAREAEQAGRPVHDRLGEEPDDAARRSEHRVS